MHPNFPHHLNINPSSFHPHLSTIANAPSSFASDIWGTDAQSEAIHKFGIAGRIWEAAYFMALYVTAPPQYIFDPPFIGCEDKGSMLTMVELGSGTGLVGACIADVMDPNRDVIFVTDLPDVGPLLTRNLSHMPNGSGSNAASAIVKSLSWGNEKHVAELALELSIEQRSNAQRKLTHIICSDLVYFPELFGPLLRTLLLLSSPPFCSMANSVNERDSPTIVMAYKIRSLAKETPFWAAFGLWFEFKPVLHKIKDASNWCRFGRDLDDDIYVFVGHRRYESGTWAIPPEDTDLINGVGAWGTQSRKCDDTFETLLLMSMDDTVAEIP